MNTPSFDPSQLRREIEEKERLLADLEASLPAHSIRPHQIQRIEELEEEIRQLKERLKEAAKT